MNVQQVQLSFVAEQDRLLFRMNGSDGAEIRAWFTRRLIKLLWPNLLNVLGKKIALQTPAATPEAQKMIAGMQHEAHMRSTDFSKPFQPSASNFPLGEEPFLVSRVDLNLLSNAQVKVGLKSSQGKGIDVDMSEQLFHGFCKLLQESCKQASWDMELHFPGAEPDSAAPDSSRLLN